MWSRSLQVQNWDELTEQSNGTFPPVSNWENSDTPVELNAVTPGPRISILSYLQMQKHKWRHSLLNETLFYSIMLGLWIRWSFYLNIKLKWNAFYLTDFPSRPHVLTFSFISPWQVYNKSSRVKKLTLIRALRFALWKVLGKFPIFLKTFQVLSSFLPSAFRNLSLDNLLNYLFNYYMYMWNILLSECMPNKVSFLLQFYQYIFRISLHTVELSGYFYKLFIVFWVFKDPPFHYFMVIKSKILY